MQTRPTIADSVSIATELWIVVILGRLVTHIGQGPTALRAWPGQVRDSLPKDAPKDQVEALSSTTGFVISYTAVGLILLAVSVVMVLLVRRGYGWARIVVGAAGVYIAINTVLSYFAGVEPTWVMIPLILSAVAALGASVLLLRPDSDRYCRDMAEFRRNRQQQTLRAVSAGFGPQQHMVGPAPGSAPWRNPGPVGPHHSHHAGPVTPPSTEASSPVASPDATRPAAPTDDRPTETIPVVPLWAKPTGQSGSASGRHRKASAEESDEGSSNNGDQT